MIIYGTKGKTVRGQDIEGIPCRNCENTKFSTFGLTKFFHIYWIPTIITSRTVGIECTHCKSIQVDNELPQDLKQQIKSSVFNVANTAPLFSGLIIIAIVVVLGIFSTQQKNTEEAAYIQNPHIKDLYIVNFSKVFPDADPKFKYGIMRIKGVNGGQVEFQVSKVAYNKTSGARKDIDSKKAVDDTYYDDETTNIDTSKLASMKETGAIDSIKRIE